MGLHSLDARADAIIQGNLGSFTLGPEATSPLDLASAYSTLAANGTQCDPKPVLQVLDRAGKPLEKDDGTPLVTDDNCTPEAIPAGVATTLNQILVGDVSSPEGTGTRAAVPGHEIAGKTGTSQKNWSAAFVGYTPQYAASVMVLNPKANENVCGFGGNKPATIWHDAMAPILEAQPAVPFPPADPVVVAGTRDSGAAAPRADGNRTSTPAPSPTNGQPQTETPATPTEGTNPGGGGGRDNNGGGGND